MRESLFTKQNSERWKRYETAATRDPDEIAERFISITDDLAYAKTFYPKSKTTAYLNGLAGGFHQSLYKNKKEKTNRIFRFWKYELPLIFRRHHRELLYSLIFFVVFLLIGIFSAMYDKNFLTLILGDDYVNMTKDNIAKGDPFGVYKNESEFPMFFGIVSNNLYITVQIFASGIFFSIGTLISLFYNSIMLGAFESFFFSRGLGVQSLLVIFIHGTLEISSIIIAAGAGLVLGNSIIFPKTYTRLASFKKGAMDGMKITLGILPLIVVAAIFESFVTRHTGMPMALSIAILAGSLTFLVWYVILYPIYLTRKLKTLNTNTDTDAGES